MKKPVESLPRSNRRLPTPAPKGSRLIGCGQLGCCDIRAPTARVYSYDLTKSLLRLLPMPISTRMTFGQSSELDVDPKTVAKASISVVLVRGFVLDAGLGHILD